MIKKLLPYVQTEGRIFAHISPSLDANLKEHSLFEEVGLYIHASYAP